MPARDLEGFDALILLDAPLRRVAASRTGGRLAVVARFGVGYDNVDVAACTAAGIALVITPEGVRRPVAVSILTFVLALAGKLIIKDRLTRQGPDGWAQRSDHMGIGLTGRTLGQLGVGNIGAEVFRLAAPFGMRLIAHDPYADPRAGRRSRRRVGGSRVAFPGIRLPVDQHSVDGCDARHSGCAADRTDEADGLSSSIRPADPILDQHALTEALAANQIAGAGLDVFEIEPMPADDPLLTLDNVILTPHSLCWTDECFAGNGAADVRAVLALKRREVPSGILNREVLAHATWRRRSTATAARIGSDDEKENAQVRADQSDLRRKARPSGDGKGRTAMTVHEAHSVANFRSCRAARHDRSRPRQTAASRAVQEAKKYAGSTITIVWEAGLQSLDPLNFSGPKWEQLTGIKVKVVEVADGRHVHQDHAGVPGPHRAPTTPSTSFPPGCPILPIPARSKSSTRMSTSSAFGTELAADRADLSRQPDARERQDIRPP